ncbi:unnamed protein product [Moneuplotes crassus]|uniref:Uncharacterized protein n=1 Tax=Euplotes crassus TaxID=5936 RepID=A0AAD1XUM2_EUPCR|nr:unnamed protein product [Moneuplotes crassus]
MSLHSSKLLEIRRMPFNDKVFFLQLSWLEEVRYRLLNLLMPSLYNSSTTQMKKSIVFEFRRFCEIG